jgi:hypothetical protein
MELVDQLLVDILQVEEEVVRILVRVVGGQVAEEQGLINLQLEEMEQLILEVEQVDQGQVLEVVELVDQV